MTMRDSEPEAHCYRCALAVSGECREFKELNHQYIGGYDRKGCHWGSSHQLDMVLVGADGVPVYNSKVHGAFSKLWPKPVVSAGGAEA